MIGQKMADEVNAIQRCLKMQGSLQTKTTILTCLKVEKQIMAVFSTLSVVINKLFWGQFIMFKHLTPSHLIRKITHDEFKWSYTYNRGSLAAGLILFLSDLLSGTIAWSYIAKMRKMKCGQDS